MLTVVAEDAARREDVSPLDGVMREGARRMLTAMLEAEVDACLAELASEDDEPGRRLVMRDGHTQARKVMTGPARYRYGRPGSPSASSQDRASVSGSGR